MNAPPHYRAFRVTLAVVLVGVLALAVWWIIDARVLVSVLAFLGLG